MSELRYGDMQNLVQRCRAVIEAYERRNPKAEWATLNEIEAFRELRQLVGYIEFRKGRA